MFALIRSLVGMTGNTGKSGKDQEQGQEGRESVEAEPFDPARRDGPAARRADAPAPCRAADRRISTGVPDTEAPQRR